VPVRSQIHLAMVDTWTTSTMAREPLMILSIVPGRDPGSKAIVFSGENNDFLWFNDGGNANPFYFGTGDFTVEAIANCRSHCEAGSLS